MTESASAPKVAVVLGSDSDVDIMLPCFKTLAQYQIPYEAHIISAHRTPGTASVFARNARSEGFGVIIAAAGKAAHLAGALAANTTLPVIAVPIGSGGLGGLDALLSSVQMPKGVPVATVAIDGAANAAILAAQILSLADEQLADALERGKSAMTREIAAKDNAIAQHIELLLDAKK